MAHRPVITNPFAHNAAAPSTGETPAYGVVPPGVAPVAPQYEVPAAGSGAKYEPPPPAGALGGSAAGQMGQSSSSMGYGTPGAFRPTPVGPKYGAPPPPGQSAPPSPVPLGYSPTNSPYPSSPISGAPQAQPGPESYGAAPAQETKLTPEERALKFPSPVELIANQSSEATRFNTDLHQLPPDRKSVV